jgi:hypothetical protein
MQVRDIRDGRIRPVDSWRMCFDRDGRGSQTVRFAGGAECTQDLQAVFRGQQLLIVENGRCNTGNFWLFNSRFERNRLDANRADCLRIEQDGAQTGRSSGLFER